MVAVINDYENIDGLLEMFVNLANNASLEIGITLQVGGIIVSGILISGKKYFQGLACELRANASINLAAEAIQNAMNDMSTAYVLSDNSEMLEPKFIHLREARILLSSPSNFSSDIRVAYWRGKLDCVEGFVLGELNFNTEEQHSQ